MSRLLDMWAGMTGTILDFAGSTAPNGWLLCYGQSLLRTDYPTLFDKIGTTYGAVDGTHFNLPDCRGRVHAGKDDMGGTAASRLTNAGSGVTGTTLGASGGAENHTLTTAQMPSHSHPNTLTDPGHAHTVQLRLGTTTGGNTYVMQGEADNSTLTTPNAAVTNTTGITITNANQGSGGAHNNTQPTIVFNKIIKA